MSNENKPYETFKKFLAKMKITQKKLAEILGKSLSFINKVLNGRGADFSSRDSVIIRLRFNIVLSEYL